ncbi:MAG: hypothetical protein B7Z80_23925 [Rhodospirillales bacterium 20-64-7]|nr:MAG: hypothetical protein B7Z80_23925 [Rhodospirillales bacterium 20-64-7]
MVRRNDTDPAYSRKKQGTINGNPSTLQSLSLLLQDTPLQPFMKLTSPRIRPIFFCLLLTAAQGAHADIYLCRDANGTLVSSDRLTSDCLTYGGRVIGADGTVRRRILTMKEQTQAAQENEAAQNVARQQRDRQREDRALLLRYPNEAALEQARINELNRPNTLIQDAKKQLAMLERQLKQLNIDAQFYPQGPLPLELRTKLDENKVLTQQETTLISGQNAEIARINREYDALRMRMQTLWARTATTR